jgi:hypothetical protein
MEIICPICEHIAFVPDFEDKKGWECDACGRAWEVDPEGNLTRHPLVTAGVEAEYDTPYLGWGRAKIE